MKYTVKCGEQEYKDLFFSNPDSKYSSACVGHLRMDFGSGKEFFSTWWDRERKELNNKEFKADLDNVINDLRKDGLLKSRRDMEKFCYQNPNLPLNEWHGFSVETENHLFLLRCLPIPGNYDCYCYCYNKQEMALINEQSQQPTGAPKMTL